MRRADMDAALGDRGVIATITQASGSTPRGQGTVMVITDTGAAGTLGGGTVEHRVQLHARQMLSGQAAAQTELDFPLGPDLDQCCGGRLRVALAVVQPPIPETLWPGGPALRDPDPAPTVYLYGAGHVGQAVARAVLPLDVDLTWVDAQPGRAIDAPAGLQTFETPLPEAIAVQAPPDAIHLIMTHSHAVDLEIAAAILPRPHQLCGLIGSATKRAVFQRRLTDRGLPPQTIARLCCPIGLPGLTDKRPAAIAASVAAQILMLQAQAERPELAAQ